MKNSKLITLFIGVVMIMVTIACYILFFDKIFTVPIRCITLTAILISEVIIIVKILAANKNFIMQTSIFTNIFIHIL